MTLDPEKLQSLTQLCLLIARHAGERIVSVYHGDFEIMQKSDETPLTTADLEANRIITDGLEALDFSAPILSEESPVVSFNERTGWDSYWLVDPLDGTREFIARNGEFSVNIALIQNGKPILGVVYAPILKVAYFAASGQGAWKQVDDAKPQPIQVRKSPPESVVVARSRSPITGPLMKRFLEKLGAHEEVPTTTTARNAKRRPPFRTLDVLAIFTTRSSSSSRSSLSRSLRSLRESLRAITFP